MIRVALGLPAGVVLVCLGQVEEVQQAFPYADLVLHGGALGVLSWAVWHAYQSVIPALRKELQEDRAAYHSALDKAQDVFSSTLNTMADRHERTEVATADRHERWEVQRHADSEKLEKSLNNLAVTCARNQEALRVSSIAPDS